MSGCFSPASLEDRDDLAVRCDCFRHQLPDRVPLRQLVGFVISSSLHQRAATSTPCQQCLEQSEFNGLAGIGKHIKLRLCCASDSDRSFLRARRQKPQSEELVFRIGARSGITLLRRLRKLQRHTSEFFRDSLFPSQIVFQFRTGIGQHFLLFWIDEIWLVNLDKLRFKGNRSIQRRFERAF